MRFITLYFILVMAITGCESIAGRSLSSSELSMDYNPGWVENSDNNITSFDQLPRHKNRLSGGHADT